MCEIFAACDAAYLDIPVADISYNISVYKESCTQKKLKGSANYRPPWIYKWRSKSSRPDLVLFRIKINYFLLLIVARLRTRHALSV